jgi:hypothetical protein
MIALLSQPPSQDRLRLERVSRSPSPVSKPEERVEKKESRLTRFLLCFVQYSTVVDEHGQIIVYPVF